MVRAKFKVQSVTQYEGDSVKVELWPVTTGSEENKTFWRYTPSGKLEMTINNSVASDEFKAGAEFYLDFTKVEKE